MTEFTEMKCPKCGQQLRHPKNIGGMLMACPSCGEKFHTDFKLGGVRQSVSRSAAKSIFELPLRILRYVTRFF